MKQIQEKVGDYFLDISKLVFAGVVLSAILKVENIPKWIILTSGVIATIALALTGLYFLLRR